MKKLILTILLLSTLIISCFLLTSCGKKYTIMWENWDGSVLEVDYDVEEGTAPTYDGMTPTREGDEQYTYEFRGWDKTVSAATGDAVYVAQFNAIVTTYNVIWKNWDGTVLLENKVAYGEVPVYTGETPTKETTAEYTYTFSDWSPSLQNAFQDAVYYASFSHEIRTYSITWKNWDGSVLAVDEYAYGSYPTYNGPTPEKQGDVEFRYAFTGWSDYESSVTEDATYTAEFHAYKNQYTVTWLNFDGSELGNSQCEYGTTPEFPSWLSTPERPADKQYTYTFVGWSPAVDTVTGDITYIAQYTSELRKYTVKWSGWDGTILETDQDVEYGTMPTYNGEVPVRNSYVSSTVYVFSGWSPVVDVVTGDVTYRAQFTAETAKYTVTWTNWDGTVLEVDEGVPYGTTPTYDGATPIKPSDAQYSYTFSSWSPWITTVREDVTLVATYSRTLNSYTVTGKNWDGTVLETDEVEYGRTPSYDGETPLKERDDQCSFKFNGWDKEVVEVTGDVIYIAQFVNMYAVTWKNWDDSLLAVTEVEYGKIPEYTRTVYKDPTAQYEYIFTGWSPALVPVVKNVTYVACFEERVRCYNITFDAGEGYFDGDMSIHTKTISYAYGSVPQFTEIPTGFSREYGIVTFIEWNSEFKTVYSDKTYVATYSYSKRNAFCIEYEYDPNNRTVGFYTPYDYTGSGSGSNYIWEVDWGDGTTVDKKNKSHTYSIACKGTYYIRFYSTNSGYVSFYDSERKWNGNKSIKRIDVYKTLSSCNYSFSGLSNVEVINFYAYTPISYCMFNGCKNLKSVTFDTTYGYIDSFAFQSCSSLENVDLGTSTITEIRESAFSRCESLKSFILPASVRTLGNAVFSGCKFTDFVIESGSKLTNIPNYAFEGAEFVSFTIPKTVTTIGYNAFTGCSNLRTINYEGTMQDFLNINISSNAFPSTITSIRCSDGVLEI